MELGDLIGRRGKVSGVLGRPVAGDAVERIIACGLRAPSAGFSQGSELLVLEGPEQTERYWEATAPGEEPLRRAPLIIVPLAHKQAYLDRYAEADKGWTDRDEARWPAPYWLVDTMFAALLMLLAIVDEGLAAVVVSIDGDGNALRQAFHVPAEYLPAGAIAIGFPLPEEGPGWARRGAGPGGYGLIHRRFW